MECTIRKLTTFIGSELINEKEDERIKKLVRNLNKAISAAVNRNPKAAFLLDQVTNDKFLEMKTYE